LQPDCPRTQCPHWIKSRPKLTSDRERRLSKNAMNKETAISHLDERTTAAEEAMPGDNLIVFVQDGY
jgi:hypothetical protein